MHRRTILHLAALGATLSPVRALALTSPPSPMMSALSTYMSAAGDRALPPEAAIEAKHHLLDTLAAMISGAALPPGQAAQRYIGAYAGKGGATIAGTVLTAAPVDAALANGVMAHADETDDSHNASRSHPGCAIVPAALAIAEREDADGAALLRAIALGYDVCVRVNVALGFPSPARAKHSTHSIGPAFGAAAAAGA